MTIMQPPHEELEIRRVANGYLVMPMRMPSGSYRDNSEMYVFPVARQMADWLVTYYEGRG